MTSTTLSRTSQTFRQKAVSLHTVDTKLHMCKSQTVFRSSYLGYTRRPLASTDYAGPSDCELKHVLA